VNQPEELTSEFEARLDLALTQALRAVDAPDGFADRLLARAAQDAKPTARVLPMPARLRNWTVGAIAAGMLFGGVAGEQRYQRHRREQAAERQFETALQITAETMQQTMQQTREQLAQSGLQVTR
jgi:hypothetical protein